MKITPKMALEVAHHEAIVRQAYKDSVGVWTWSVGLTNASGHDVTRYIDKPQSLQHCLEVYVWALGQYAADVSEVFKGHDLTEEQFTAALSFHWNTGAISRASWVRLWKAGRHSEARKAFMNWRKPSEIIPRRKAERDLFFNGVWHNQGTMPEYTRLTRNYTPVWSSRVEIDVSRALDEMLAPRTAPAAPMAPERDPAPIAHDDPQAPSRGFLAALAGIFAKLFGGKP